MYDSSCRRCPLWEGARTVCVPGKGSLDAQVLLLGEAPGTVEDEHGMPFAWEAGAESGTILRYALEEAGLDSWYIDNVVRCRPPGNRKPTGEERRECREYTLRVVESMPNLKLVVLLGKSACEAFGIRKPVTKIAGRVYPWKHKDKKYILLPLYHPSYVGRVPTMADRFVSVLSGYKYHLTGIPQGDTRVYSGYKAVEMIRTRAVGGDSLTAFDLETTGREPRRNSILAVSFYSEWNQSKGESPVSCLVDHPEALGAIREFYGNSTPKVVHNVSFEWAWGKYHLGVELNNCVGDTFILSRRELFERPGDLGTLAATFVPKVSGLKVDTELLLEEGEEWYELDKNSLGARNALDSLVTLELYQEYRRILDGVD